MKVLLWVTGPSGAGKTTLVETVRAKKLANTFDLDFVGYRKKPDDWKEWNIPPKIFGVLEGIHMATGGSFVAVGCDSHPEQLRAAAMAAGFAPVVLLPDVKTLQEYRRKRGDAAEKVAEAAASLESWTKHAQAWGAKTFSSVDELLAKVF